MKDYIAVVSSSGGKVTKLKDFATQAEADAHVAEYGGFVAPYPGGNESYWIVDGVAETLTYEDARREADRARSVVLIEIDRLEGEITNRRIRESGSDTAAGSTAGRKWMKDQEALIAAERAKL